MSDVWRENAHRYQESGEPVIYLHGDAEQSILSFGPLDPADKAAMLEDLEAMRRYWTGRVTPEARAPEPNLGRGLALAGRLLGKREREDCRDEWLDHLRSAHAQGEPLRRVRGSMLRAALRLALQTRARRAATRLASWW